MQLFFKLGKADTGGLASGDVVGQHDTFLTQRALGDQRNQGDFHRQQHDEKESQYQGRSGLMPHGKISSLVYRGFRSIVPVIG